MRYFVTGATGFVGGHVTRQLIAVGHHMVAVARIPAKAAALAALGVELHQGDMTDKEIMHAPMKGADGVFHIAVWYKVMSVPESYTAAYPRVSGGVTYIGDTAKACR